MWYAGRQWTLWVLLIALPFTVLVTGCATLLLSANDHSELPHFGWHTPGAIRTHLAMILIAGEVLTAGGILVIVVLHMLAN